MRIKKYYAPNPQDAFKQIKAELGIDAMILGSQKVKQGGLLGFLKTPVYEITVGVDAPQLPLNASNGDDAARLLSAVAKANRTNGSAAMSELEEMKASIRQLQVSVNELTGIRNARVSSKRSTQLARLHDLLVSQGLDEQATQDIMKQIEFELSRKAMQDWAIVRESATRLLEQRFATIDVINGGEEGPTVIFVVGPTGVGKTTSVAKLAATFASDKTRNVSLVTVDTLRIGAIPQLQAYADILGLPLEVVYSPAELARILDAHSPEDVVFIDTPGWSPRGAARVKLPEFVNAVGYSTVFLAMSATTKDVDAVRAVNELDGMPLHAIIVTKLDETNSFGSIFNFVNRSGLPVAYVATGQCVPEDIEPADPRKMALRLLGVEK